MVVSQLCDNTSALHLLIKGVRYSKRRLSLWLVFSGLHGQSLKGLPTCYLKVCFWSKGAAWSLYWRGLIVNMIYIFEYTSYFIIVELFILLVLWALSFDELLLHCNVAVTRKLKYHSKLLVVTLRWTWNAFHRKISIGFPKGILPRYR